MTCDQRGLEEQTACKLSWDVMCCVYTSEFSTAMKSLRLTIASLLPTADAMSA